MTAVQRRAFRRFMIAVILLVLPVTVSMLWMLPSFTPISPHPDVPGLTAVSIGIVGILVFYIFLYKFQTYAQHSFKHRMIALAVHAGSVIALFSALIWLGFGMEWSREPLWGSYDCETAVRSWIIAVIVIGTITGLGSFFDAMRTSPDSPFAHHHEDQEEGS